MTRDASTPDPWVSEYLKHKVENRELIADQIGREVASIFLGPSKPKTWRAKPHRCINCGIVTRHVFCNDCSKERARRNPEMTRDASTQGHPRTVAPMILTVYVVEFGLGHDHPAEVDSIWTTSTEANKRAVELGPRWTVGAWNVRTKWEAES